MPIDALVARDHVILVRGGFHEPRAARVVEQRGVAAPAVRVRVRHLAGAEQDTATLQLVRERRIRFLEEQPARDRHVFRKVSARIDGLKER
jgi:hypothetical protein